MEEYVDFLKDSVVADQKIVSPSLPRGGFRVFRTDKREQVTYRLLSRSLKVHVDVAKE